jgi:hypothetical protein
VSPNATAAGRPARTAGAGRGPAVTLAPAMTAGPATCALAIIALPGGLDVLVIRAVVAMPGPAVTGGLATRVRAAVGAAAPVIRAWRVRLVLGWLVLRRPVLARPGRRGGTGRARGETRRATAGRIRVRRAVPCRARAWTRLATDRAATPVPGRAGTRVRIRGGGPAPDTVHGLAGVPGRMTAPGLAPVPRLAVVPGSAAGPGSAVVPGQAWIPAPAVTRTPGSACPPIAGSGRGPCRTGRPGTGAWTTTRPPCSTRSMTLAGSRRRPRPLEYGRPSWTRTPVPGGPGDTARAPAWTTAGAPARWRGGQVTETAAAGGVAAPDNCFRRAARPRPAATSC